MTTPTQHSRSALPNSGQGTRTCKLQSFTKIRDSLDFGIRHIAAALFIVLSFGLEAQCPSPGIVCSGNYSNVVICEVSGDSGQSDGSNDAIVELCGPPGADIGCMVISNGEWAVVLPSGAVLPADGVYLITCSEDSNGSGGTGIGSAPNGQIAGGNGDYNAGFIAEIDFDVCDATNANFYDPAASGFTLDNTSTTDGDAIVLFQPDGTVHDAVAWSSSPGASGNADNCLIQSGPYTLGDNDGNGIVNDNAAAIPMGRCDGNNAIAVPLMPAGDCNADQVCYTMPQITNGVYTILNPNNKGCNSSYIRLDPGTSQGGQNGAPSYADGKYIDQTSDDNGCPITLGSETQESFTSDSYTPSACGTNVAEWAYTDHPTPGQRNDEPTFAFYIDNSVLCMPQEIEICAEVYNYQHVSDNIDIGSGIDNGQTGSYVFNPITGVNETWDTYEISGETTTLCKKINITDPGAYSFGAVIDDYSNCCGTSGDPHSQANPNECYETQNFFVTLLEPALYDCDSDGIADDPQVPCSLSCDSGSPAPGVINATNFIVGGGNLQFQLIDNSGTNPTVSNSSGIFNIPDDATANAGYRIDVLEMASCGFSLLSIAIDDNCELEPICPESVVVTVDGSTETIMACPNTEVELCFDGNQLSSGGSVTWQVDEGAGFTAFESIPIPSNDPGVFVYLSAVFPDPASSGSASVTLCGSRTEWVILTNADPSNPADISGYTLEDNGGNFRTVSSGTMIPAGGTYLVCVGSTSRLANGGDFVDLLDPSNTIVSNVTWTSNPGDDTSAGSGTPPVVTPADPAYNSVPSEKEFCVLYTISFEACPSLDLDFRAVIDPFASSCPDADPDVASALSEVLQVTLDCPTASIASTGIDVCAIDMSEVELPVTINDGVGPYVLEYTVDGVSNTSFGISSGDNLTIFGPTAGEVKVILGSITDEGGANCSGSVSDAEVCVNIRPSVELTVSGSAQATDCLPCDGTLTFDLTAGTTSTNEFDIDYSIDGTLNSLSSVMLPFTLTGLCPGSYDIVGASDDAGCDMIIESNLQVLALPVGEAVNVNLQPAPICGMDGSTVDLAAIDYSIDYVSADFAFYTVDAGTLPASALSNTPPLLTTTTVAPTSTTTYYVVYTDPMTNCESTSTIQVVIDNSLCCDVSVVNGDAVVRGCSLPGTFVTTYNLTEAENILNGDVDGDGLDGSSLATVTYHATMSEANAGINSLPSIATLPNVDIYARVSFSPDCFEVVLIDIQLFTTSEFEVIANSSSTCGGADGSILFFDLVPNTSFQLIYTGATGSVPSGNFISTGPNGEFLLGDLQPGTYSVTLGLNIGGGMSCSSDPVTIQIVEPEAPTISDLTVCVGTTSASIVFDAGCAIDEYSLDFNDIANAAGILDVMSTGAAGTNFILPPDLMPGTYQGEADINCDNLCTSTSTFNITVVDNPVVTLAQTEACESQTYIATPTGEDEYVFFTDTNGDGIEELIQSGSSNSLMTVLPAGTTLYVRAINEFGCTSLSSVITVDNEVPTYSVKAYPTTSCDGDDGAISIGGLDPWDSYLLSYMNDSGLVVSNTSITTDTNGEVLLSDLTRGNYSLTVSTSTLGLVCDGALLTIEIQDPPTPIISINSPAICVGTESASIEFVADCDVAHFSLNYNNSANVAGFQDVNTNVSPLGAAFSMPANVQAGTYLGTASVECGNSCNILVPFEINVVAEPEVELVQTVAGCTGGEHTFVATPAGMTEYVFYTDTNGDGIEEILHTGSSDTFSATMADGVQLFVEAMNGNGCSGVAMVSVSSTSIPTYTASGTASEICGGEDATILFQGLEPGVSYLLDYHNLSGMAVADLAVTADKNGEFLLSGLINGTYYLSVALASSGDICKGAVVNVELQEPPVPVISINSATVCIGTFSSPIVTAADCIVENYILNYNPAANDVGFLDTGVSSSLAMFEIPDTAPIGTYGGTAQVVCDNSCSTLIPFEIIIVAKPEVELSQTVVACENGNQTFVATPSGLTEYVFYTDTNNDGVAEVLQSGSSDTYNGGVVSGAQLFVRANNSLGCMGQTYITVANLPAPTIIVNDPTVCVGTTEIPIEFAADCTAEHFLVEYDDAANAAGLEDMSTSGSATNAMYMLPDGLAPGVYDGTVIVVCDDFCNNIDEFTITVVEAPAVTLAQTNDGCTGEELIYTASPSGLTDYTFYTDIDGDGVEEVLQTGSSESFATMELSNGVQLFVRASNGQGDCSGEATVTIVREEPCSIYDVALMKILVSTGPFGVGDLVEFQIEVFNQSNQSVYNLQVADYLPVGLDFFAADNMTTAFSNNPDTQGGNTVTGMAVTNTALPAGESLKMSIFLRIGAQAINGTLFNVAEIISATQDPQGLQDIDDQDDSLDSTDGGLIDEDDNNIEDETAGGSDNVMDEDDFDFAALRICTVGCNGTFPWNGQN